MTTVVDEEGPKRASLRNQILPDDCGGNPVDGVEKVEATQEEITAAEKAMKNHFDTIFGGSK